MKYSVEYLRGDVFHTNSNN